MTNTSNFNVLINNLNKAKDDIQAEIDAMTAAIDDYDARIKSGSISLSPVLLAAWNHGKKRVHLVPGEISLFQKVEAVKECLDIMKYIDVLDVAG